MYGYIDSLGIKYFYPEYDPPIPEEERELTFHHYCPDEDWNRHLKQISCIGDYKCNRCGMYIPPYQTMVTLAKFHAMEVQ